MKTFLSITIDVEPDCSPTWHYARPLSFKGVSEGIGEKLHPLFQQFGIQPTYLINNVVLENKNSVDVFKSLSGVFELGTHLHGDFIAPEKIYTDYSGKDGVQNQCFLKPEIEYGKLKNITSLFSQQFGYSPISFRAGRFSAGKNTIASLVKLGYKIDTSVTPKILWNDPSRERPVDFVKAPLQPYWTSGESFPAPSFKKELLQVPVSIIEGNKYLFFKRPMWLRPFYSDAEKMIRVGTSIRRKFINEKLVVLNMMFHNVEVMPLLSPYTKNRREVTIYLDSMKRFFEYCITTKVEPATLSAIYHSYCSL